MYTLAHTHTHDGVIAVWFGDQVFENDIQTDLVWLKFLVNCLRFIG